MKKAAFQVVFALLLTAQSCAAGAWWGWGPAEWMDEFLGGAGFSFSMTFSTRAGAGDRYYDYFNPYALAPGALPGRPDAAPFAPRFPVGSVPRGPFGMPAAIPNLDTEEVTRAVEAQRRVADGMSSGRQLGASPEIGASGPNGDTGKAPAPQPPDALPGVPRP